jgi:hypothetical protein
MLRCIVWTIPLLSPDDGGSKHLRNVGKLLRGYTAEYRRRDLLHRTHSLFCDMQDCSPYVEPNTLLIETTGGDPQKHGAVFGEHCIALNIALILNRRRADGAGNV